MRTVSSLRVANLQQQRFDLAVCSMVYRHFPSVEQVTRDAVEYLKPNGMLVIASIMARVQHAADGDSDRVNESEAPPIIPVEYEHLVSHTRGSRRSIQYACVIRGHRTRQLHL
ncbi:hypothetical protein BGY98DRAFT_1128300 [Russula aff. rugulosa BPL654]|nr:hypothetical protein BGY98DRAFT_1128300 [Russula aff. rugulosa BPL654]